MKPDFTLSLSSETLQLLHRSESGWSLIGEAQVADPDVAGKMAALRARALGLGNGAPFGTKILIPNEQIRYLALDTTRADEDDVRAALEGATPYPVSELVYDFVAGGGRTYIAAVSRQTLAEAEAFALTHELAPLCFCAAPVPFTFLGEVFFGPTRASRDILPFGTFLDRDPEPVIVTAKLDSDGESAEARPAAPPFLSTMAVSAASPDQHGAVLLDRDVDLETAVDGAETGAALEKAPVPDETDDRQEPVASAEPVVEPPAAEPAPDTEAPLPVTATVTEDAAPAPAPAPAPPPLTAERPTAETMPPAPRRISLTQPPQPDEAPGAIAPPMPKMTLDAVKPSTEPPSALADEKSAPGFVTRRDPTNPPKSPVAAPDPAPGFSTRRDPTNPPKPPVAEPSKPPAPPVLDPQFATRRDPTFPPKAPVADPKAADVTVIGGALPAAATVGAPVAAPDPDVTQVGMPLPGPTPPSDPEKTVIGAPLPAANLVAPQPSDAARPAKPVVTADVLPGTPARNLQADNRPASQDDATSGGFFSRRRKAARDKAIAEEAKAEATPTRSVFGTKVDPEDRKQVGGKPRFLGLMLTVLLLIFMAAVAAFAALSEEGLSGLFGRSEPQVAALPTPTPESGTGTVAPDTVAATEPEESEVETAAVAAETEPDPAVDPLNATDGIAPAGAILSPDEAQRIYAATGVWQRAPRLPLDPRTTTLETLQQSAPMTAPVRPVLSALPGAGGFETDLLAVSPPPPPPAGVDFPRDENGFILATPEGTLTPDGILVFAGAPALRPPPRGGEPEPAPTTSTLVETDDLVVLAGAPPVSPPVRVLPVPTEGPAAAADGVILAEDGLLVLSGAPPLSPPVRSAPVEAVTAAPDADPATEDPQVALDETSTDAVPETEVVESTPTEVEPETEETAAVEAPAAAEEPQVADLTEPVAEPQEVVVEAAPVVETPDAEGRLVNEPGLVVLTGAPPLAPPVRTAPTIAVAPAPDGRPALVVTDDLVVLTGAPAITPPVRSGEPEAALSPSETIAPVIEEETAPETADLTATDTPEATRAETDVTDIAASALTEEADPTAGAVTLAALRPAARPAGLQVPPGATLPVDPALEGFRPRTRPAGLAPPEPEPEPEPEPVVEEASPAPEEQANAVLAAAINNAVQSAAAAGPRIVDATNQAVPVSVRPDNRPRNFARVVQQARQNQQRQAQRQQEQQQQQQAAAVPRRSVAAATGPTPGGVAAAATIENAINLRQVSLIGVYGTPSNRRALVRLGNGRYVKVSVGDRLDGGRVAAIGEGHLDYTKRGRTNRLDMPG